MLAVSLIALSLVTGLGSVKPSVVAGLPVQAGGVAGRVWTSAQITSSPRLVVVLHGDLAGPQDDYQYVFARRAADHLKNSVVIAALRPGYEDSFGARSVGHHGLATGDNYTPQVIKKLRAFIEAEGAAYHARDVTLVGHSGGAVIAADLVEDYKTLASRLLLVSCPCELREWRPHMALRQMNPLWLVPVESQSPMDDAGRMPHSIHIRVVVGERDAISPPRLSIAFARAAGTTVVTLPGAGHNVLLDPRVMQTLISLQESP